MKKRLLFFLICLSMIKASAQSSNYFPFPVDSATWSVDHYDFDPPGYVCWNTYHYGFLGDTVILGLTYHKIGQNNFYTSTVTDSFFNPASATYVASIREDSSKTVYALRPSDTAEVILYDFSLQVGDTFNFEYFLPILISGVVTQEDSVLVGSSFRRSITIVDGLGAPHVWVEGMGCLDGLFQLNMVTSFSEHLLCFSQEGQQVFGSSGQCHCDNTLGISESSLSDFNLVFPNPTSSGFYLQNEFLERNGGEVVLYNSVGEVVVHLQHVSNNDFISLDFLQVGYYSLEVRTARGNYFSKVIKSN